MSQSGTNRVSWRQRGIKLAKILLVLIAILLLWWSFRQVPLERVWSTLRQLRATQVAMWFLVNIGLVILITGRWWLILRAMDQRLSLLNLTRYRLAAFAISFITPGPQFGGEPVQVLALRGRHGIPGTTGTASVGLDRLLELVANFSFLVFGIMLTLSETWLAIEWQSSVLYLGLALLALPLVYLVWLLNGKKILPPLVKHLPVKIAQNWITVALCQVEDQMSIFCVRYPRTILSASLLSVVIWVGWVFEYWLLTHFLGLGLSLVQSITALTAARLALLTPLPGGLGALAFSQVFAMNLLGLEKSFGISISLLIRSRDILFGLIGLFSAMSILNKPLSRAFQNPKSESD